MKYHQLQRFKIIDKALYMNACGESTSHLTEIINEVMSANGQGKVSLRQVQTDINNMKTLLGAPISNARGQRRVRYEDMTYYAPLQGYLIR